MPPDAAAISENVGLTGALAGDGFVRVAVEAPTSGAQTALFMSSDVANLFAGPPQLIDVATGTAMLSGLANGVTVYFGFALRAAPGDVFLPVGPVLSARPAAPIYVDPNANPGTADGTSPATAYANPILALLDSFSAGGANVWMAAGEYPATALPVFGGTAVYGGFTSSFDPAERDPSVHVTRLHGLAGQALLSIQGAQPVVFDGVALAGDGVADHGVDMDMTPISLRGVDVSGFTQRGVRVRAPETGEPVSVQLVSCSLRSNAGGGFSGLGNLDVEVFGSSFTQNGQEGLDLDDLIAADGKRARLGVYGSLFASNVSEGLDVDLNAPGSGGTTGGEFDVEIVGCAFLSNGTSGLLIDVDYLGQPLWKADLSVRGNTMRANGIHGVRVDVDERANVFLANLIAEANGGNGIEVSSGMVAGVAVVATSVALGNGGAGIANSAGLVELLVSHCVVAGNEGGGYVSPFGRGQLTSSVALLQNMPTSGFLEHGLIELGNQAGAFVRAPELFLVGGALSGGAVSVPSTDTLLSDQVLEVAGDGVLRTFVATTSKVLNLDPAPNNQPGPTRLMAFGPGVEVDADWTPSAGSTLLSGGYMGLVDAGPAGLATYANPDAPTVLDSNTVGLLPLRLKAVEPPLPTGLSASGSVTLRFSGGTPSAASLASDLFVEDGAGHALAFSLNAVGDDWRLDPAGATWGASEVVVTLAPGIATLSGAPLAAPVAIHWDVN